LGNLGEEVTISGDARDRQAGGLAAGWHASAWDLLAIFLVFSARFADFLAGRDYGFLHMEVLAAFSFLLLLAGLVALVIALRAETLRPFVLSVLVVVALHNEIKLIVPEALTSHLVPEVTTALQSMVILLPTAALAWALRAHISKIVAAVFCVMVLSSIILPKPPFKANTVVEQEQVATTDRGPIIHLILDQQIGIDGLVDAIPGAAEMRGELLTLYKKAGFRVYGSAFTHFPATLESLPNLMNNSVEPNAHRWVRVADGRNKLKENRWFRHLKAQGYVIDVLQTHYVDFCADPAAPVSRCENYNLGDVRFLHDLDVGAIEKSEFLVLYSFAVNYEPLSRALQLGWHAAGKISALIGLDLPAWNAPALSPSTVNSLNAMDRVADRLETIEPGQAYVAHLLLPHDPFMLEENCEVKSRFRDWADRKSPLWWLLVPADPARQRFRYQEYFKQMRCLNRRLAGLFEILDRRGLANQSTVIIHGDHGSLITSLEPVRRNGAALSTLDIISSYSTLFAVKAPGLAPGLDQEFSSIQGLFARHVMGLSEFVDHDDIFLKPDRGVIGPGQKRRPMVVFEAAEDGVRPENGNRDMEAEVRP
jgi:hypothetical protein